MSASAPVVSSPPSGSTARSVVASLTDEEIDVLCDGDHHVVVLPHLSSLDRREARIARRAAERSLVARGLLLPAPESAVPECSAPDNADRRVAVHDLLAPVLQTRQGAPIVVVLHRTPTADLSTLTVPGGSTDRPGTHPSPEAVVSTGTGTRSALTRYLFVLYGTCVCEDVTGQGVHTLSVGLSERVGEMLTEFLVPPGACAPKQAGTIMADPTDLPQTLHLLGHPIVLAEATILHPWIEPGQAAAHLLSLGPGGCYRADLGQGRRWVCEPASPDGLVRGLLEEITAGVQRVAAELDEDNGGRD